jgi:hypothetical protein
LTNPLAIRTSLVDYDGDGDIEEGLSGEIASQLSELLAAIQSYAQDQLEAPIVYAGDTSPYFFIDLDDDDKADQDETRSGNKYQTWTPRLLRAAFNYHTIYQDGGGYAHNGRYLLQLLYDSIEDLDGDVTGTTRP